LIFPLSKKHFRGMKMHFQKQMNIGEANILLTGLATRHIMKTNALPHVTQDVSS
jgi:hypothetical protein